MRALITFSGAPYEETTRRIVEVGPQLGADRVVVYDDRWILQTAFYRQNRWLWDHPHKRGFGWYAWKPFIIQHALLTNDEVLYVDADTVPITTFGQLYRIAWGDGGIMLFASEGHRQFEWCKRDCYVVMGQDDPMYYDVQAGVARFMVFGQSWLASQFLQEWIAYCVNPLANTFDVSVLKPELPGFIEHRAEQAIMTNLAHKYQIGLHREACEAGNGSNRDRALYGQLFTQINHCDDSKVTHEPTGSSFFNVEVQPCVR